MPEIIVGWHIGLSEFCVKICENLCEMFAKTAKIFIFKIKLLHLSDGYLFVLAW